MCNSLIPSVKKHELKTTTVDTIREKAHEASTLPQEQQATKEYWEWGTQYSPKEEHTNWLVNTKTPVLKTYIRVTFTVWAGCICAYRNMYAYTYVCIYVHI